jgi:hypothetical protein
VIRGIEVPRAVNDITPGWLTHALSDYLDGGEVTAVHQTEIIWGTSTKVRIVADFDGDPVPGGPRRELCVKGEFDAANVAAMGQSTTHREVVFYDEVAPQLEIPVMTVWYGAADPEAGGVMVTNDLLAEGVTFGEPAVPISVDEVAAGLETLGRMHGASWGREYPDIPFLHHGSQEVELAFRHLFSPENWAAIAERESPPPLPSSLDDRDRIVKACAAMFDADRSAEHCLIHGDAHIGNTYTDPTGQLYFLDWPAAALDAWALDVSYFIAGSLSVKDRRSEETALLRSYLDVLVASGGPDIPFDEAWFDYRRHQIRGMIWVTLPPSMQPAERVNALTERYSAAVEDLDTLRLLGV